MEGSTKEENGSYFDTFLLIILSLESIVWLLYYIASITFLFVQGISFNQFLKYSLPVDDVEKQPKRLEFVSKVSNYLFFFCKICE